MTNILNHSRKVTGRWLFHNTLPQQEEILLRTVAKSIKKEHFDVQGLPSLAPFPPKTPFRLAASHTHLQTVKKTQIIEISTAKADKVVFLHEVSLYRQLSFPQIHREHCQKVVGTSHQKIPTKASAAQNNHPFFISFFAKAQLCPWNSPNACRCIRCQS